MKDGAKPSGKVGLNEKNPYDDASELWHEELERSYKILKSVLHSLSPEKQRELIELLQTISEDRVSQETSSSPRKKALSIMDGVCKDDRTPSKLPLHEPERRIRERRQADWRQHAHNFGNRWSAEHIRILEIMANQNIPLRRMALRLGRTSAAVELKARELNIPLSVVV